MKPLYQTRFGRPMGNCMAASLASILEWPLSRLDPLPVIHQDECPTDWADQLNAHLIEHHGFYLVSLTFDPAQEWRPPGYHLLSGPSPRGDFDHTIVGFKGKIVHDPNPVGGGFREGQQSVDLIVFNTPLLTAVVEGHG